MFPYCLAFVSLGCAGDENWNATLSATCSGFLRRFLFGANPEGQKGTSLLNGRVEVVPIKTKRKKLGRQKGKWDLAWTFTVVLAIFGCSMRSGISLGRLEDCGVCAVF